jgi:hypothetical protein
MSPPPIDLSDDVRTLQLANRPTLAASLEFMANDIAPLLFGRQTGVFAVVEDAEGRRRTLVTLISGFRAESDLHIARNVVQQGPFEAIRNGERVTYVRVGKEGEPGPGVRIEYDRAGTISRIETAGGVELPIPAVAPNEFGEVTLPATPHYDAITIGPNQHHAEMRLYDWATRNKLKIISMTPTRGCCVHCQRRLMAAFKHEFHDLIPLHRQSKRAYIQYRRWLKRIGLAQRPNDLPVRLPPSELKLLSDSQSSALRNAARRDLATLSQIDPRLMRISRYLRVVGPAMLAFDVATSAAKAADQWRQGAGQEATTTLAALGGRLAGAYVGAEAFGAIGGGLGSVVPGLGTTI